MKIKIVLRRGLSKANSYEYLRQFKKSSGYWMDFRWINFINNPNNHEWAGVIVIGDTDDYATELKSRNEARFYR